MNPEIVFSVMLGIRRDHPRRRIEMKFCMVAGLQKVVLRFEFHQNQLTGFGAVGGESKFALCHWFGQINGKKAKSVVKGKFW